MLKRNQKLKQTTIELTVLRQEDKDYVKELLAQK